MYNKLHDFWLKKNVLWVFCVAAMLSWLAWAISVLATGNPVKLAVFAFIFFALTAGMTWAYIKGETNVQKMLFGSLLIFFIVDYVELFDVLVSVGAGSTVVVCGLTLVVLVVFYICHTLQQLDSVGKEMIVMINQCCGIAAILEVVYLTINVVNGSVTATDYAFCLAAMLTLLQLICMETRISKYKQIRAKHLADGSWNAESRSEAKKLFKL